MALDEAPSGFLNRRPVELAETTRKRDQFVVSKVLAAEQQHQMVEPVLVDRCEGRSIDGAKVGAANLGAQRGPGRQRDDRRSRAAGGPRILSGEIRAHRFALSPMILPAERRGYNPVQKQNCYSISAWNDTTP